MTGELGFILVVERSNGTPWKVLAEQHGLSERQLRRLHDDELAKRNVRLCPKRRPSGHGDAADRGEAPMSCCADCRFSRVTKRHSSGSPREVLLCCYLPTTVEKLPSDWCGQHEPAIASEPPDDGAAGDAEVHRDPAGA